jgi:hypothetical protein
MGHEQVLLSNDPSCGYLGIVAIHDTSSMRCGCPGG